jgi:hypothetical protein
VGRKAISGEPMEAQLRIRLLPAERAELDAAAVDEGEGTSTWARRHLLEIARTRKPARKPRRPKAAD